MTSNKTKDSASKEFDDDVRDMFNAIDVKGDKCISVDELFRYLKKIGVPMTTKEVKDAVAKLDSNRNGKLEFREFHKFLLQQSAAFKKEQERETKHIRETFRMFDRDGNGVIDRSELRIALKTLLGTQTVTNEEITDMMNEVDLNSDGRIDFEEFTQIWWSLKGEEDD